MDAEAECYWMTDKLRTLMESIPEAEWTEQLSAAWELRQDFHDDVCRWEAAREERRPSGPMPDPQRFRMRMIPFGFSFLTVDRDVQYRPKRRVA